jgi:arylformamidase
MPYVLSPIIKSEASGMWSEGPAYEKKCIYSIASGKLPAVNYDEHIIRAHSLTHLETPAHTQVNGRRLESYYKENLNHFFGKTLVIKLAGNKYVPVGNNIFHWVISLEEIKERIANLTVPNKILITTEFYPVNNQGFHDPNYILTLSQEAADFLVSLPSFDL